MMASPDDHEHDDTQHPISILDANKLTGWDPYCRIRARFVENQVLACTISLYGHSQRLYAVTGIRHQAAASPWIILHVRLLCMIHALVVQRLIATEMT
jgi:hypothetical protein